MNERLNWYEMSGLQQKIKHLKIHCRWMETVTGRCPLIMAPARSYWLLFIQYNSDGKHANYLWSFLCMSKQRRFFSDARIYIKVVLHALEYSCKKWHRILLATTELAAGSLTDNQRWCTQEINSYSYIIKITALLTEKN